jgi:CheY-like chemotaxis protein
LASKRRIFVSRLVLVADDSPTIQKKAVGILKGEGFDVETVSNGVAAIKRLSVLHPVVVLADVSMPGRDGYEVCEYIKNSAELSQVPVLLVASDMEPYDDARGAEVRADGIIKKPFEARELIAIVVKCAEQFEAAIPTTVEPVASPSVAEAPLAIPEPTERLDDAPTITHHAPPDFSAIPEGVAFSEPVGEEPPQYSPGDPLEQAQPYTPGTAAAPSPFSFEPMVEPQSAYSPEPALPPTQTDSSESVGGELPPFSFEPAIEQLSAKSPEPQPEEAPTYPLEPAGERSTTYAPEPATEQAATYDSGPSGERAQAYAPELFAEVPGYSSLSAGTEAPYTEPHAGPEGQPTAATAPELPEAGTASAPPDVPSAETSLYLEEPAALGAETPSLPAVASAPSIFDAPEATAKEPVFIEEHVEPPAYAAAGRATVFRTPLDIAEPVWSDETIPETPSAEPAGLPALESQPHAEVPSASPEIPAGQPPDSPQEVPSVAATNLDSFSLDDAAAGQVRLASMEAQVAPQEPADSGPAAGEELPLPSAAPVAAAAESVLPAPLSEVPLPEPSPHEPPVETAYGETASHLVAPQSASPKPRAEGVAPAPPNDWPLIYSVVHKVVVRMSPPPLPVEVVEEIARRLAVEIASEISSELSPPST